MGPTNKLIGGDNKGLASYLFEKSKSANYSATQTFVAAFAQSNAGDVTPNLWGPADGVNDYARQKIIAEKQLNKAQSLYSSANTQLTGSVDFRHTYVNFSNLYISSLGTTTCPAGMGASFSAGSVEDNAVSVDFLMKEPRLIPLIGIQILRTHLKQVFSADSLVFYGPLQ